MMQAHVKTITIARQAMLAMGLLLLAGCGGVKRMPLAPVTGRILNQGKPLANVEVNFHRSGASRIAYAVTDDRGGFTLSTYAPHDGAPVGQNTVTLRMTPSAGSLHSGPLTGEEYNRELKKFERAKQQTAAQSVIPEFLKHVSTSGLKVEVLADGPNEWVYDVADAEPSAKAASLHR